MKPTKSVYKLCDIKWAISEDFNIVRPCIFNGESYTFLIEASSRALTTSLTSAELKKLEEISFQFLSTEVVYCTELKSAEGLTAGFYEFSKLDLKEESFLDFCAKVHRLCLNTIVTFSDLLSFRDRIKEVRNMGNEIDLFNIKTISLNDLKKLTEEIKNGKQDL